MKAGPQTVGAAYLRQSPARRGRSLAGLRLQFHCFECRDQRAVQSHRSRRHAQPPAHLHVYAGIARLTRLPAPGRSSRTLAQRAYRAATIGGGPRHVAQPSIRTAGRMADSTRASSRRLPAFWPIRDLCSASNASRRMSLRDVRTASAIWSWLRASRSSSGAASPTTSFWTLAIQNKLHDPAVLEAQTRRMLADARSEALVTSFGDQWLYLRELKNQRPEAEGIQRQSAAIVPPRDRVAARQHSCARIAASSIC